MEASTVGGCARSMFLCSKHMCSAFVSLLVTSLLSLFGDREDMITHLYDYTNTQKIAAPVIAVGMACTTRGTGVKHIDQLALFKFTLPSIARTTEKQFVYRVYVVHDSDDVFFEEHSAAITARIKQMPSLSVRVLSFNNSLHKPGPAMNFAMRAAHNDGADYLYRINDDTEMQDPFASSAISTLQSLTPPLVGVVGPRCAQGNTKIFTHDFVHRTHLNIFTTYYPVALTDWWLDDWITHVYGDDRTVRGKFTVTHHIKQHGTRYTVTGSNMKLLDGEVQKGKDIIARFLRTGKGARNYNH